VPSQRASLAGLANTAIQPRQAVPLDDLDLRLLALLSQDCRSSQRQLAIQLGVSAPTVGERMGRLERAGVIRGYSIQVDWEALGYGISVWLSVSAAPGHDLAEVMRVLWDITEVEEVSAVTGSLDLLVRVRVRDHTHMRSLLMNELWHVPGLQGTETMVAIAEMAPKQFLSDILAQMQTQDSATASGASSAS
jgi:DNA-binding Lrp family transcriptional regulator